MARDRKGMICWQMNKGPAQGSSCPGPVADLSFADA